MALDAWSWLRFVAAVVLVVYLPGRLWVERRMAGLDRAERLALACVLGLILSTALFGVLAWLGLRWLFALWPLGCLVANLRGRPTGPVGPPARARPALGALAIVPVLLAWGWLALLPLYYRNLRPLPDGGVSLYPLPDLFLHLSVAHELTHAVPPSAPYVPGHPLPYHYASDLMVTLLAQAAGLDVVDATVRFAPTLFFGLAGLSIYAFGLSFLGSERGAALLSLLVLFGEDLSFVPGLWTRDPGIWSVDFFGSPSVLSLFTLNPMLPALAVLFAALVCLNRLERDGRRFAVPAALLVAALIEYKVFCAAQLLAALGLACLGRLLVAKDTRLLWAALGALALGGTLALLTFGGVTSRVVWSLHPAPLVPNLLLRSGLWETWLGHRVQEYWTGQGLMRNGAFAFWLIALPAYLLGALGLRTLALVPLAREVGAPFRASAVRSMLAAFVGAGVVLGLSLSIVSGTHGSEPTNNEAVWFLVQSKYVAWVLAVEVLQRLWRRGSPRQRPALMVLVALAAFPSAAQQLWRSAVDPMDSLSADEAAGLRALAAASRPGDVVLADGRLSRGALALTRCHAPVPDLLLGSSYMFRSPAERRLWEGELSLFWQDWREGRLRPEARSLFGAAYVLAPVVRDPRPPGGATRLFENASLRLYSLGAVPAGTPDLVSRPH
jgi:hypothetical protein